MKKIILTLLLFFLGINFAHSEFISGENYPDKIQRNIDKIIPSQKYKVDQVCKNSDKAKDVWIYSDSNRKIIDVYAKCRVVGTGYHEHLKRKSDYIANSFCKTINGVAIPRGKAKHAKGIFDGFGDLIGGNLQVIGNSYVCKISTTSKETNQSSNIKQSSPSQFNFGTILAIIIGIIVIGVGIYNIYYKKGPLNSPINKKEDFNNNKNFNNNEAPKYASNSPNSIKKEAIKDSGVNSNQEEEDNIKSPDLKKEDENLLNGSEILKEEDIVNYKLTRKDYYWSQEKLSHFKGYSNVNEDINYLFAYDYKKLVVKGNNYKKFIAIGLDEREVFVKQEKDYYLNNLNRKFYPGKSKTPGHINYSLKNQYKGQLVLEKIDPNEYRSKLKMYHWSKDDREYYAGYSDKVGDINYSGANKWNGKEVEPIEIYKKRKKPNQNDKNKSKGLGTKPGPDSFFNSYGPGVFWIPIVIGYILVGAFDASIEGVIPVVLVLMAICGGIAWYLYEEERKPSKPKTKTPNSNIDPDQNMEGASGSGFFINKEGYVITNHHVIGDVKKVNMSLKGRKYHAIVIASDAVNDLAVLKATPKNSEYFRLSNQDAERMDDVTAVGYGFGKAMSDEVKATRGVVSALSGLGNNYSHMQIDAAIQPGNSGGPVINKNGDVVGVAVAKADAAAVFEYTGTIAEGISFAIKTSTLKQFLKSNKIKYEVADAEYRDKKEVNKLIDSAALFIYH